MARIEVTIMGPDKDNTTSYQVIRGTAMVKSMCHIESDPGGVHARREGISMARKAAQAGDEIYVNDVRLAEND